MDRNFTLSPVSALSAVALRKESVDRNIIGWFLATFSLPSLSARRAWIEITAHTAKNTSIAGRSPQGERG